MLIKFVILVKVQISSLHHRLTLYNSRSDSSFLLQGHIRRTCRILMGLRYIYVHFDFPSNVNKVCDTSSSYFV